MTAPESFAKIFFFSKKRIKKTSESETKEFDKNNLLCRFVLDGTGKKVGESIAIEGDIVIIKSGNKYLGVPLKHIKEEKKTLLVKGLVDKDKAKEMGENWRRESLDEIQHVKDEQDEI